jgi:flagellar basal-body rod protein FlgB
MAMTNPSIAMINDPTIEALSRFLDVNVARHKLIAANLANIDTPGYHARDLDFRAELSLANFDSELGGEISTVSDAAYVPLSRPVRGLIERPDGNDVSVERETLLMAETQMRFNLGIALVKDGFHSIAQAINSGGTSSS